MQVEETQVLLIIKICRYFLGDEDGPNYEGAYLAQQNFVNNGQINWNRIYDANLTNASVNLDAAYVLYEDRADDKQLSFNSVFSHQIDDNIKLSAAINHRSLLSDNFAEVSDLLGGFLIRILTLLII